MNLEQVKEIANAVLYEGYLLYPYRQSAIKSRTRWTFGVVYPREYSEANGGTDPWTMHTECLVEGQAIEVIHQDFENRIYLVITADDVLLWSRCKWISASFPVIFSTFSRRR